MLLVTVGSAEYQVAIHAPYEMRTVVMVVFNLMLFGLFHNPSFHLARNFKHSFPSFVYPSAISIIILLTHSDLIKREKERKIDDQRVLCS